ncbi:MAG: SusC/RagA family TonB-linked outer membrane protein [Paludibacter sp.]|nr:SusC/RagA family TonB-linked outer membrane protein [Paludibacter sp.]
MKIYNYIFEKNRISFNLRCLGAIMLFVFCFSVNATKAVNNKSTKMVAGIVRDAHTKKPVYPARISLINGKAFATTDEKGIFRIEVSSAKALLNISAADYNVREFPVQGSDSVIVELFSDQFNSYYKKIDGVSGIVDNSVLSTSIKSVTDLSKSPAISADDVFQTELGGDVRAVSRSSVAGVGSSLFIRGMNSLNSNAQPLFVVDGVIWNNLYDIASIHDGFFSNPLNNIDVTDIESITVLKDGTSLYGSKAANGVIQIKTKRGKDMVTRISLNVVTGMTTIPKSIPVMGANDYKSYVTDIIGTAGLTNDEISQLPYLNDNPARSIYKIYHNNTDWSNQIYKNGFTKSYSINVNGGDEKALYYLSLGYTGNNGTVKSTDMQRYNLRLNGDIHLTDFLTLGLNTCFSRIDRKLIDDGVNNTTSPTWISLIKSPFLSPNTYTSLGDKTTEYAYADVFNVGNPSAIINYANNTLKQTTFNFDLKPVLHFSPDFSLSEQFDYNMNKTDEDYYRPYLFTAPIFIEGIGNSYNARRSQVMRNNSLFSDTRLSYVKQFDKFNHLNAFLGTRYLFDYYESDYVDGHNSLSNSSINLVGSFSHLSTSGINNQTKSISNYANVDYSYDNRYLLNMAMSIDGSSRFGNETEGGFSLLGHSWGVFPSINGAWLISSEKFMKNIQAINFLKLRAGYGITGNDDIKDYQTMAYFTSIRLQGVANGLILSNIANPKIQWETTGRFNVGLDVSLLNERLFLSVDAYSSLTKNLLVRKVFQDVTGLDSYWSNQGSLSNKGIEISLNSKLFNFKNFQWELGFNVGHYINKITELPNGEFTTPVYDGEVLSAVGSSAGVFYGYKTNGVYATDAAAKAADLKVLNNNGSYSSFGAGDVVFDDKYKDGIIDSKDKQIIGNPNPTLYGTITNKFSYRKIMLTALFSYSYGNDVYNYQRSLLEAGKDYSNQSMEMLNRWTSEGQVTSQPKSVFGDPQGNSRFSDRWIEDGSYIRLKSLSLSYNIVLKSNFIESVNVWVSANNLLTLTRYLGADPEFSVRNSVLYQGVDAGLLPSSKSYYIGLKFNL